MNCRCDSIVFEYQEASFALIDSFWVGKVNSSYKQNKRLVDNLDIESLVTWINSESKRSYLI